MYVMHASFCDNQILGPLCTATYVHVYVLYSYHGEMQMYAAMVK